MQEFTIKTEFSKVDIIIVSYYDGDILFQCINNLLLLKNLGQIILVNNGNSLVDEVRIHQIVESNSKITLLSGHGDVGFAKACNMGSNIANEAFIFFLNPNYAISDINILHKLIDSLDSNQYKAATCLVLGRDNTIQANCRRNLLTPLILINETLKLYNLCGKFKRLNLSLDEIENLPNISELPALSSIVIFTTKEYFEQIKGFDESYFLGVEDLDISMRIKINGDKIAFVKNAVVKHLPNNNDKHNELSEVYKARGNIIYIQKFFPKFNNVILGSCLKILIGLRYMLNVYAIRRYNNRPTSNK